jgi:TP901-1 family phage major tail protein
MAAQRGKDLLIKIDDGAGNLVTVAGLRACQLAFNAEAVDVTNSESAGRWRELLAGAGMRRAGITGAGVFKTRPRTPGCGRSSLTARSAPTR